MRVEKVDAIPYSYSGKYRAVIQEFLASGDKFAEVILDDGDEAGHARNVVRQVVKRHNYPITVIMRHGRLFFAREGD